MANYTLKDLNSLTWHFWWKCGWPLNILGPLYITTIYCIQQSSTLSTQTFTNLLENGLHLVVYCDKLAPTWKHVSNNCACLRNDSQAIPEWTLTGYNHDYHLKKKKAREKKDISRRNSTTVATHKGAVHDNTSRFEVAWAKVDGLLDWMMYYCINSAGQEILI